jgi:hypothetical protein
MALCSEHTNLLELAEHLFSRMPLPFLLGIFLRKNIRWGEPINWEQIDARRADTKNLTVLSNFWASGTT